MITTCVVENPDGKFIVIENDTLGQHLLRGERWEEHFTRLVQAVVRPGDVAVDVGANIGYNAVVVGKAVGDAGAVFAFEPLRVTYQQLCGNVVLNGLTNVRAFNCALGNADRVVVSMVPVDYNETGINIMNSTLGVGGEHVEMRTLDSFALQRLDLLKIDVQGCELVVLKGASETIKRCRPLISIEIEEPQARHHNTSSQEIMFTTMGMGYNLLWNQSVALYDWIAVPTERADLLSRVQDIMGAGTEVFMCPR